MTPRPKQRGEIRFDGEAGVSDPKGLAGATRLSEIIRLYA